MGRQSSSPPPESTPSPLGTPPLFPHHNAVAKPVLGLVKALAGNDLHAASLEVVATERACFLQHLQGAVVHIGGLNMSLAAVPETARHAAARLSLTGSAHIPGLGKVRFELGQMELVPLLKVGGRWYVE